MDVDLLSRIQFAFTISFHYIYPPLSIGLGVILVIMEGTYLRTKDESYKLMTKFWVKIFALIFAIGVATGIVMEFEFGTNWAVYSRYVGDVFGSALAAEGIFAFALESGFLGLVIFGWNKVSPKVHFFATLMVSLGSIFSAIWIVVANSWQQTPAGYHIVQHGNEMRAEITDFWAMVFNPSSMERLSHVIGGALLAGAFLVLSVNAFYILKNRFRDISIKGFRIGIIVAVIAAFYQLFTGHLSADGVSRNQPEKLAAFEGHYEANAPADMYLAGWVDEENEKVYGIKIPGGLSFLVHWDFTQPVTGLKAFKKDEIPGLVNFIFQFYHLMVAIGIILIVLTLLGILMLWKKKLFEKKWLLIIFIFSVFLPQFANQLGWYAAEVGRQPWVVYRLLRTSDAISKNISSGDVIFSLILFTFIYLLLFLLFIYLLDKKIKHGPYDEKTDDSRHKQSELVETL